MKRTLLLIVAGLFVAIVPATDWAGYNDGYDIEENLLGPERIVYAQRKIDLEPDLPPIPPSPAPIRTDSASPGDPGNLLGNVSAGPMFGVVRNPALVAPSGGGLSGGSHPATRRNLKRMIRRLG